MDWWRSDAVLRAGLVVALATLPVSLTITQGVLYCVCLPVWAWRVIRTRDFSFTRSPYFWPLVVYAAAAIVASALSLRPEHCLNKSTRLVLATTMFMAGVVYGPSELGRGVRLWLLPVGFIAGVTILGAGDAWRAIQNLTRGSRWLLAGNMRDAQFYMVALCFLVTMMAAPKWRRWRWVWTVATVLCAAGLVLHLKRGTWGAMVFAVVMIAVGQRRYRLLVVLAVAVAGVLTWPAARARLANLEIEMNPKFAGRYVLWMQAAPDLFEEYPWGIGYGALKRGDFTKYSKYWLKRIDHLHSNALQTRLEIGPVGLIAWLAWIVIALRLMTRNWRAAQAGKTGPPWLALGTLAATTALLLDGIVEYNFGDSEILILFSYLMAISYAQWLQSRS